MKFLDFEKKLNKQLGERAFALTRDLVALGIYGTLAGARLGLSRGDFSSVKLSPRRWGVPRLELLEHIRKGFKEKQ